MHDHLLGSVFGSSILDGVEGCDDPFAIRMVDPTAEARVAAISYPGSRGASFGFPVPDVPEELK